MTEQEIIDDIFDNSEYFYPETFKFLKSLPNSRMEDGKTLIFFKTDVVKYAFDRGIKIPEGYLK